MAVCAAVVFFFVRMRIFFREKDKKTSFFL